MSENENEDTTCVLMVGNLNTGWTAIGPFDDFDSASEYDEENFGGGNWIMSLVEPK